MCLILQYCMVLTLLAGLGLPCCAPARAWAVLPADELWRESLLNHVVGFGKDTTGGAGGTLCEVTNLNDTGAGSLRACAEATGAMWIVFRVNGTINVRSMLYIKSNKTVDGRGADITINGCGFEVGEWSIRPNSVQNVIIANLKFEAMMSAYAGCGGYVLVSETATDVWIDHNTFRDSQEETVFVGSNGSDPNGPDGGIPPDRVTISWNHFAATEYAGGPGGGGDASCSFGWCDKGILVSNFTTPVDQVTSITSHHNYHENTHQRNPAMEQAKLHAFNNYLYRNNVTEQNASNGRLYSENEIFECEYEEDYPKVKPLDATGNTKAIGYWLVCGSETIEEYNPSTIFTPSSFYTYTPDTANAALKAALLHATTGAGAVLNPYNYLLDSPTNLVITATGTPAFPGEPTSVSVE